MTSLISRAIALVSPVMKKFQVKRFLSVVLVGFLVLTTNVNPPHNNQAATNKVYELTHQDDSQRPKTTGEWQQEARETENAPGERLKNIAGESAEAFKQFGSVYPDTAKKSADNLKESNE